MAKGLIIFVLVILCCRSLIADIEFDWAEAGTGSGWRALIWFVAAAAAIVATGPG